MIVLNRAFTLNPGQSSMDLNYPKELNHLASRNQQSLLERVPLLAPGPFQRGGFYNGTIPGIWFLLQGHKILESNPSTLSNGTSRWTSD